MSKVYSRFLSSGSGPVSLSDSWVIEGFSIKPSWSGTNYSTQAWRSAATPATGRTSEQLPSMPEIGRLESYYARLVRAAEQQRLMHHYKAAKVGQYITLGMDPNLSWEQKLKYFRHALNRHCSPPLFPDDHVWSFYQDLANHVREHCGYEALRLASAEDDFYAARLNMGQLREKIEDDAEEFFLKLLKGFDQCPEWFNSEDWQQIKLIRDQWI